MHEHGAYAPLGVLQSAGRHADTGKAGGLGATTTSTEVDAKANHRGSMNGGEPQIKRARAYPRGVPRTPTAQLATECTELALDWRGSYTYSLNCVDTSRGLERVKSRS